MRLFKRRKEPSKADLGNAARDRGDWAGAAQAYKAYVRENPGNAAIWTQLGHSLKEMGDLEGARLSYARSLELNNGEPDTYLQMGHLLKRMGRLPEARTFYMRALALGPSLEAAQREYLTLVEEDQAAERRLEDRMAFAEKRSADLATRVLAVEAAVERTTELGDRVLALEAHAERLLRLEADLSTGVPALTERYAAAVAGLRLELEWHRERIEGDLKAMFEHVAGVRQEILADSPPAEGSVVWMGQGARSSSAVAGASRE